jgi:glycosyltransferase involved in cell wall biosynthesis
MTPTIKLLSIIEATTVTGPAKNLLGFCRLARSAEMSAGLPRVEVSVVTFERGHGAEADRDATPNAFVAAARAAGVEVEVIGERFRFDPRVLGELRRVVERRAPDIVQTHMVKSHFLARLAGLGRGRPWVAYHHGYTTTDLKMLAYNRLNRWSLPAAERVITVCGPFAERLTREGVPRERISVRHNSVVAPPRADDDERRALREKLGADEGARLVLAVGRLSREKGHADLVRSFAAVCELHPALNVRLVIVGEGPEREGVEAEARAAGVLGRVVFAGHTSNVRPYYAAADVLALPSHSEGSPNVLLEAMAAGLPVVATAVGGVPEIATDEENALLVPAHDTAAFAAALGRVLTDEGLAGRLGRAAAERAVGEFSPEAYARGLVEIYNQLLAGGAPRATPQTARG